MNRSSGCDGRASELLCSALLYSLSLLLLTRYNNKLRSASHSCHATFCTLQFLYSFGSTSRSTPTLDLSRFHLSSPNTMATFRLSSTLAGHSSDGEYASSPCPSKLPTRPASCTTPRATHADATPPFSTASSCSYAVVRCSARALCFSFSSLLGIA